MIMFPPWRFKLREAQVALEQGRLEEAAQIVGQPQFKPYLPVQQLLVQVSEQLARRALERAATGDFAGGWRDLDEARQLAGETADWQRLQQAVADVAVGEVVQHLAASDFPGAASRLEALDKRKMAGVALQTLREVTKRLESARKLSQRGKFAEAEEQLAAAAALRPDLKLIDDKRQVCRERAERSRMLNEQLHAAIAAADWTKVAALRERAIGDVAGKPRGARCPQAGVGRDWRADWRFAAAGGNAALGRGTVAGRTPRALPVPKSKRNRPAASCSGSMRSVAISFAWARRS